ncbi:MAG: hypothetical protein ACRD44_01715 [Bryobacteraceae bacterium]
MAVNPGIRSTDAVEEQEVHDELDKILRSPPFQRSERLQRFLRFVCEWTLKGDGSRINEYLIGAEVFERGPEYSPHEDGIVRRQAHALRRKLHEYYEHEGLGDRIRIDLPVGRYVPSFRRVEDEKDLHPHEPPTASPVAPRGRGFWPVVVLTGVLLFAAGWIVRGSLAPASPERQLPPEVREIWGPWLADRSGALICFSNPLTAVVKHFAEPLPRDSTPTRLPLTREQEALYRSVVGLPPGGYLYLAPAISQAKMGEAFAGVYLANLFSGVGRPIRVSQSRFLSWEDLTRENVILLGHSEANPWLDRLLDRYPFKMTMTHGDKPRSIVNTAPVNGESRQFLILYPKDATTATEEHALISMIPGADGRHRLLLIGGLNTQATQVAAEYLTSPASLRELMAELRKQAPAHTGQWHFQAVLRTEVHDKVPTKATLVALRVINP